MTVPNLHLIFFLSLLQYFAIARAEADGSVYIGNKDPVYIHHSCSASKTFAFNGPYHVNLNTLLSSLSSHATGVVEFYNTTVTGGGVNASEAIYGLFLCHDDVTGQMCQKCVQLAIQKIASRCLYSKEAIIWYHECLVRYSSRSIFSNLEEWPRIKLGNFSTIPDTSNQGGVGWVLANTLNEAITEAADGVAAGEKKFATRTGKVRDQKVCTLVQCSHDLTSGDCRGCLRDMMADIPLCCLGRYAGMVLYPSCSLMFGLRLFYREVEAVRARSPDGLSASHMILFLLMAAKGAQRPKEAEKSGHGSLSRWSSQSLLQPCCPISSSICCEGRQGGDMPFSKKAGTLSNGQKIAVKRLSTSSEQGTLEFKNEILLTAKLQHRNLVTLLGFCLQEHEKILVYKFAPNKNLDYFLFDSQDQLLSNWSRCFKIIEGVTRAILYLHEHSRLKIIHRDLKPSNIL